MFGRSELAQQFSGKTRAEARRHCQGEPVEGSIQFHGRRDATTLSRFVSIVGQAYSLSGLGLLALLRRDGWPALSRSTCSHPPFILLSYVRAGLRFWTWGAPSLTPFSRSGLLGGCRTLPRFFLLTTRDPSMVPLRYVNAE